MIVQIISKILIILEKSYQSKVPHVITLKIDLYGIRIELRTRKEVVHLFYFLSQNLKISKSSITIMFFTIPSLFSQKTFR